MEPDPVDPPAESPLPRPAPPRSWRERVEDLADATGTSPRRLVLGGLALAVAGLTALWLTRPPADPVEVALPFASTTMSLAQPASTSAVATVVVHVAGAVAAPGVYELDGAARVMDAVAAAGGLTPEADGAAINLASPVVDGQRVYVTAVGEVAPPVAVGGSPQGGDAAGTGPGAGPVNLNQADVDALDALPGVGPATAAAIIEHRDRIGGFTSVDQLLDVRGIGEAKLEALRDLVTV